MKVGRNDPCPCGSGKKYKKCCAAKDEAAEAAARAAEREKAVASAEAAASDDDAAPSDKPRATDAAPGRTRPPARPESSPTKLPRRGAI